MNPPRRAGLSRLAALALLLVMGAMWGLQFAMLKLAAQGGQSELNILMLAMVLLSIVFTCLMVARRQLFRVTFANIRFFLIIGLIGYVAPLLAALQAAPHIPAGILSLIATMAPVATISIALVLRSEAVSWRRVLAVGFGALAVALVFWPQLALADLGLSRWMLIALIVPLCYGIESIYIAAAWPKGLTPLQAVTGETLAATLMVVPLFVLFGAPVTEGVQLSLTELAVLIFVAAGVVESLLYFTLIKETGGVFVSFGTFVSLFAGIAWGMMLFGESHGLAVWAAVVALCVSLLLACLDRPAAIESH
ncbi:MAG: DMT family transporter [Pseudomonadota bacterium]